MNIARLALVTSVLVGTVTVWLVVKTRGHQKRPSIAQQQSVLRQQSLSPQNGTQASASPSRPGADDPVATLAAERVQRLGPFSIVGNDYTIVLHEKSCVPGPAKPPNDLDLGQTVVAMEIQDAQGAALYQRKFPYSPGGGDGSEAWKVSAGILSGPHDVGLLVQYNYEIEPDAPQEEYPDWWQIFGVVNGKLKAFGAPIYTEMVTPDDTRKAGFSNLVGPPPADQLQFKKWTGHFRIVFPVRVDWTQGKLTPVEPCEGATEDCQYKVLPEDLIREDDRTFVSLCPSVSPCESPERVVVQRNSKVDLLLAQVQTMWNAGVASIPSAKPDQIADPMQDAGGIRLGPADGTWLKVRIDGKEGWMHGEEDFNALGLPRDQ